MRAPPETWRAIARMAPCRCDRKKSVQSAAWQSAETSSAESVRGRDHTGADCAAVRPALQVCATRASRLERRRVGICRCRRGVSCRFSFAAGTAPLLLGIAGFAGQFLLLFLVTVIRLGQLGSTRRKWGRRPRVRQRSAKTVRYAALAANCRIAKNTTIRPSPSAKATGQKARSRASRLRPRPPKHTTAGSADRARQQRTQFAQLPLQIMNLIQQGHRERHAR